MLQNESDASPGQEIILSIETAVEGGSLSISANGVEIDGWSGTREISKAEDVLEQISVLLERNNIAKKQIGLIGVSRGAGSSTGEKIGLAIAKGIQKSLSCRLIAVFILEAMLSEIGERVDGEYLTAISTGRNHIHFQKFIARNNFFYKKEANPQNLHNEEFAGELRNFDFKKVILSSSFQTISFGKSPEIISAPDNLAKLIGKTIFNQESGSDNELGISYINL